MAVETPLTIGLQVDVLWDYLPARHVGLTDAAGGFHSEAVQLYEDTEYGVFFVPQGCGPVENTVAVNAQGEDGGDLVLLVTGTYVGLTAAEYSIEALRSDAMLFSIGGLSPSLGHVIQNVPLRLLPEELKDVIVNIPFYDAEELDEMGDPLALGLGLPPVGDYSPENPAPGIRAQTPGSCLALVFDASRSIFLRHLNFIQDPEFPFTLLPLPFFCVG